MKYIAIKPMTPNTGVVSILTMRNKKVVFSQTYKSWLDKNKWEQVASRIDETIHPIKGIEEIKTLLQ